MKAADVCYYSIYIHLATEGGPGIGQWLSCITPVNDAILVIARLRSEALVPALEAPCEGGFLPPDEEHRLTAQVFADTQAFVKMLSDFPSPGYLKRKIKQGLRLVVYG